MHATYTKTVSLLKVTLIFLTCTNFKLVLWSGSNLWNWYVPKIWAGLIWIASQWIRNLAATEQHHLRYKQFAIDSITICPIPHNRSTSVTLAEAKWRFRSKSNHLICPCVCGIGKQSQIILTKSVGIIYCYGRTRFNSLGFVAELPKTPPVEPKTANLDRLEPWRLEKT